MPPSEEFRIFHGKRIDLYSYRSEGLNRELVVHPGAAVILPLLPDGRVVMIRNQRFSVGEELWELPAGTLEEGEEPAACASRELEEETGFRSRQITPLLEFYSSPGFCTERLYAFLAEDLESASQNLDPGESIQVELLSMNRILQMIRDNQIRDGKTITTLLYYQQAFFTPK